MNLSGILNKILTFLRVRSAIGGLEVSDTALHYTAFRDGVWRTASLRLPQGLIVGGEIANFDEFTEALRALRAQILGPRDHRTHLNVVVSLSSINIYTQVFSLPMIEGENLKKAIQLNIQMVSPNAASETYSGWQLVGQDQSSVRLEILSAFINRGVVDGIRRALVAAGFAPYSIESRALSLSRLVRELGAGVDRSRSYLLVNLDPSGLEFIVVRRGQLYFQYFTAWKDITGPNESMTADEFRAVVVRSLNQVLNFYSSHWSDALAGIFVAATALADEIQAATKSATAVPVTPLVLRASADLTPDWFVSLGSGLRGLIPRWEDRDISLLGVSAQDEFRRHQIMDFGRFWRLVIPSSLIVLVAAFIGSNVILSRTRDSLDGQLRASNLGSNQSKQINDIRNRVKDFNRSVDFITAIRAIGNPQIDLANRIFGIMVQNGVILDRFIFRSPREPITIHARAAGQDQVIKFQKILDGDQELRGVDVPLSGIVQAPGGVTFSVNFTMAPPKAP